uniref:Uncharacterized protein n=1 Tax=Anguilla anguilla TaxID=7936 RepID=A0A0E9UQY9_ANGAN
MLMYNADTKYRQKRGTIAKLKYKFSSTSKSTTLKSIFLCEQQKIFTMAT